MSYGIVAIGESLGESVEVTDAEIEKYTTSHETVRSWGYRRFRRADDGVLLTDLAVQACEQALKEAAVDAAEVDLVVLAIADFAEYLCWDAAAAVQGRIGAVNAEAILVNQACCSGVMAFDTAAGRFATHENYHHALIVASNRICDTYQNRMETSTSVLSDGAVAALVRRGHERGRWLATETISDGRYANFFRMDVGGTAHPFGVDGAGDKDDLQKQANPLGRVAEILGNDARRMLEFFNKFGGNMRVAVDRVCARTGIAPGEIKRFLHLNDNQQAMADIAKVLDVPLERFNGDLALDLGHFGSADQMLGLHRLTQAGELQDGDIVALTTLGGGMHWAVTLLRI
ncbi:3-oxoacyl-ACP synthase III family protein [Streptomyces sp. CMB-StM0423]|uniref:3-oxoacyl-ACP synthase III family protein n=1 Tax=Streptomyces sp. CMB-StM0423 TaxID=2059884 RepID=UPI000C710CC5|nr:3-oxoacyl-[acyl-carrier-protein] synthase III C-terminal domain-containing protein [Streptomyces sp. CMB-StM0423]AUH44421.1 3-oxoacyl-ACP synthase [Streptomyces sp. CMB-StM0423]